MGKLVALLGVTTAAVVLVATATASHSWGSYHWARTANPFMLNLGDNVSPSTWGGHLTTASSDWSQSSVLRTTQSSVLRTTIVTGNGSNCSPTSGRVEVCNGLYGSTGWLGIARIWALGTHITQGVVQLNDTYFNTLTYNTSAWRQLVMCQEVGHTFGLDHQDENNYNGNLGSCMDYTSDPDGPPSNEHPNQHDYDQLVAIYTHLDGSSGGGTGCPGKSKKCQNGLDKAPPFSQASRANGNVYVDDLGNGNRRITHVFWTPFGE